MATTEDDPPVGEVPHEPPTAIGLGHWDAQGAMQGSIQWIVQDPAAYISYANLAHLSEDMYLLGWGVVQKIGDEDDIQTKRNIASDFWIMEIDGDGNALTEAVLLDGVGWGDVDQWVSLGNGRAAWAYIANPRLTPAGDFPDCNQPEVQMTVYTAAE